MKNDKETSLIILELRELSNNMKTLTKELKRTNSINERLLITERKKTLTDIKSTN